MNILQNQYLIQNLTQISNALILAFVISFLLTPLVGRLANYIGAIDLPASMRRKSERGYSTRLKEEPTPRPGGLAMLISIFLSLIITNTLSSVPKGVILGILIVATVGLIDDKFNLSGRLQLLGQFIAASAVVASGISITGIHILNAQINFNWFNALVQLGQYNVNIVLPADIITILWILGMINAINWVGGIDGLNPSVSGIALLTMLLFAVASGNIPLAIFVAIHLGSLMGIFPYNYNPSKIFPGSTGDFINGFLLAMFAILGSTRWTATLVVLGMPIIDAILVVIIRLRDNKEVRKNPLKILSISDTNHLHHRLLAAGYSRKTVMVIEMAIMAALCSVAIFFSDIRQDITVMAIGLSLIFIIFSLIAFLKKRNEKNMRLARIARKEAGLDENIEKAEINVIYKDQEKEDEKFIY